MQLSHMKLDRQGPVWILCLQHPEKDITLTPPVLAEWMHCLDQIESHADQASLLIHSTHPKTWCNGIDLSWFMTQEEPAILRFMADFEDLLLRLSLLSVPTLASITGNCYAGGALLAAACDFRFMRQDRGRFCFSEIKVKIPFTPCMFTVLQQLPHPQAIWQLALTGNALSALDAQELKLLDRVYPEEILFHESLKFAETMAEKHRATYTIIKQGLRQKTHDLWKTRQAQQ